MIFFFYLVFRLLLRFGSIQPLWCVQPRFAFIRSFRRASLSQRKVTAAAAIDSNQGRRQWSNGRRTHGRKRLERYCHWWWAGLAQYQRSQQKIEGKRVAKRDDRKVKTKAANLEEQKICHRVSLDFYRRRSSFTPGLKPHQFIGFYVLRCFTFFVIFTSNLPFYIGFFASHIHDAWLLEKWDSLHTDYNLHFKGCNLILVLRLVQYPSLLLKFVKIKGVKTKF